MAIPVPTPKDPTDQGFVCIIVPFGESRSRRIIIPSTVAEWLMNELGTALVELKAEARARRRAMTISKGK